MFLLSGHNTERGIAAHAQIQHELSDREVAAIRRKEAAERHRRWIEAIDRAKAERQEIARLKDGEALFRKMLPRIATIVREIAGKHGVEHLDIMSRSRKQVVVKARNEVFYTIKTQTDWSYPRIGRMFERDHTVVIHGIASHALAAGLPRITKYDVAVQRERKADRNRTRWLWDKAA